MSSYLFRFLPASLALLPLIIAPGMLFYFDITGKIVLLCSIAATWIVFSKREASGLHALCGNRIGRWYVGLLAAQALSILVSTAFSGDFALAVTGGEWRRCGAVVEISILTLACLLAARSAVSPPAVILILRSCTVTCLLCACYGMMQFFGWDPFLPAALYHAGEGIWTIVRTPSTLGNASYFANYLVYAMFFAWTLISKDKQRSWRMLAIAAVGCSVLAIVFSGTRAGLLGLACGVPILIAGGTSRSRNWLIVSCLLALTVTGALTMSPLGAPL